MSSTDVLIVGDPGETQLGGHLVQAAGELRREFRLCDTREAYRGSAVRRRVLWWLGGRRPSRLEEFSRALVERVRRERPGTMLVTGLAPVTRDALDAIGALGVRRLNFLTDDPWNRAHKAPWFLRALPSYDRVFSPRHANLHDLRRAGARGVEFLPFGYNPAIHRHEPPAGEREHAAFDADVALAGGADADRVAMVAPLIEAGLRVALYGGYWSRYRATRRHARGFLDASGLRKATAAARVSLGLVRRANRDGHSMRTYEIPAMRGCLLAERTSDHERLFGAEGDAVLYFSGPGEALEKTRWLLAHPAERERLAGRAHALITTGEHSYRSRLAALLGGAA